MEYRYTDPLTGCDNLDTVFVTVHELPDAVFNVSTRQCRAVDSLYVPVELGKGHRFNWDFGNGDTQETIDAPASYRYPAIGEYPVTLIVTSVYNCVVEGTPQVVKVLNPPPTALFETDKVNGCGPLEVAFRVDPAHLRGIIMICNIYGVLETEMLRLIYSPESRLSNPGFSIRLIR